ncbi:MAG TPA: DNA double-strand break repair nuclease NurA [Ktedonobacteraceae bacterium]|nr:DNA double-strand break repair nuclease NurA [Ktedonobacteraceae bacterium]
MASFTDLIAERIHFRKEEFLAGFASKPTDELEYLLAQGIQAHWHPFEPENTRNMPQSISQVAAVDGSRAIRALSSGADWVIAQALLIGSNGLYKSAVDTILLRGEIERPAVDRCATLLMRSLELELALKFVEGGDGQILILDGSLYADLPYLLYRLAIGGYEDLPLKVLEQYLELFDLCQKRGVLLLGISKSARSAVLGSALLDENRSLASPEQPGSGISKPPAADAQGDVEIPPGDAVNGKSQRRAMRSGMNGLPTDGELMHRWTKDTGLTDPVLLGSSSFGRAGAIADEKLTSQVKQVSLEPQLSPDLQRVMVRLSNAPAIGTFYVRLAPGDDALRVDALASTFGRHDLRLLGFTRTLIPYTTAIPLVQYLSGEYGGLSVYHAALYVVDKEVRLHAATVDHVYLSVLRRQLGQPVQYDRSTRRFIQ